MRPFNCRSILHVLGEKCLLYQIWSATLLVSISAMTNPAQASSEFCELSHLNSDSPTSDRPAFNSILTEVEVAQLAENLAIFRLESIFSKLDPEERVARDTDFHQKYQEFVSRIGSEAKAKELYQSQMRRLRFDSASPFNHQQQEKKQREEESLRARRKISHPFLSARKAVFHEIPAGSFELKDYETASAQGTRSVPSPKSVPAEITKPFSLMDAPVTQSMWVQIQLLLGFNGSQTNPSKNQKGIDSAEIQVDGFAITLKPDNPVERVSWTDIKSWLDGLNRMSKDSRQEVQNQLKQIIPDHQPGDVYDLPTNAQWEYAVRDRGRSSTLYPHGNAEADLDRYAWFESNSDQTTHPVGEKLPILINGHRFYDIGGHVKEWLKDSWVHDAPFSGGKDPYSSSGSARLTVGGGFHSPSAHLRTSQRFFYSKSHSDAATGFRLVRTRPSEIVLSP